MSKRLAWAVLIRRQNRLDGYVASFEGTPDHPSRVLLFHTRREARAHIETRYGYLRQRPDLRREPHGWLAPIPIRVSIEVNYA